ncbi:unnamed protein product [Candida verbasci]|uniref:TEL2-interacting protein 1 n=1 Tax=Candida verbasci TaxID=1227364 RepID=A0A9W4XCU4_9ASCO|nr:unnamed protein product [Candida verbasci]
MSLKEQEKVLSKELFDQLKPCCIELSQESLIPNINENKIISLLTSIESILNNHYNVNHENYYRLLPNIADYIFFPISSLLKLPNLSSGIIQHILNIISFLLDDCWSYTQNYTLIDQLFPLILYLSSEDLTKTPISITEKSIQFKCAAINALFSISKSVDASYYDSKRLVYLSNSVTILLAVINSTKPEVQENIDLIIKSFDLLLQLMKFLSSSQQSMILPGIVSSITNFVSTYSNLNYQIIIKILRVLSMVISSSFNDKDLNAKLNLNPIENLSDLHAIWDDDERTLDESINDITITEVDNRSMSWLKATSKQLKTTLIILFKSIILRNKTRLQTNNQLNSEVLNFVISILKNCFISLFTEFASLSLDILSLLIFTTYEDKIREKTIGISNSIIEILDSEEKQKALFALVKSKLSELIESKISTIIFSTDEDKIIMNFIAIQFNFMILYDLSKVLNPNYTELNYLKRKCLNLLQEYMVDNYKFEHQKKPKSKSKINTNNEINKLDSIELPSYINVKNIATQKKTEIPYVNNIKILARKWTNNDLTTTTNEDIKITSKFLDTTVSNFIQFLASLNKEDLATDVEQILESSDDLLNKAVSLWIASNLIKDNLDQVNEFNPNDFLNGMNIDQDQENEVASLILMTSEEIISNIDMDNPNEIAFTSALKAISTIVGTMTLDSFRTNLLMDHLIYLFQALTLTNHPTIQHQAQLTIKKILDTYYNGSMVSLVLDNADYLIDSISLLMSVASQLTPMLPGILLIITKVAGIQLLESNQLNDIITDMFVIIDSYHGYTKIVESFFIVFEALIEQIVNYYNIKTQIEDDPSRNKSMYKPWGMTNEAQLKKFLKNHLSEPAEEEEKFFERPADKPFSEIKDSDDEDSDDEQLEKEEPWTSPIPKNIYMMLQKIFKYGFVLISQPSHSLQGQILKCLNLIYPLLSTNYNQILPIITSNWPHLVALITNSNSLSTTITNNYYSSEDINLIIQSLKFVSKILKEDRDREEFFFSRKFQETWDFISNYSSLKSGKSDGGQLVSKNAVLTFRNYPKLKHSLIEFLILGVQNYERQISDSRRYDIVKLCYWLNIPDDIELSRDTLCIIEVLKSN